MDQQEIYEKLKIGEAADVECKLAQGGLPNSVWETYSAMANTNGGMIFLGIKQINDLHFEVVGISDALKLKRDFWNTINNPSKVSKNIMTNQCVHEVVFDEGIVLVINVPRAPYGDRPVFLNGNPMGATYKRNYEGDYKCSDNEVRSMFADQKSDGIDRAGLENYSINDLDMGTVRSYRNRMASTNPDHPFHSLDDADFLRKLQVLHVNRITGKEELTVAGILMFGKYASITEALPEYFLDYREELSDDPEVRWTDRVYPDGKWEANLFQFYFRAISKITQDLKIPFQLAKTVRVDDTHVHEAIREAMINALVHANYYLPTGIVIQRKKTCLIFSNPGNMKIPPEIAIKGGRSAPRNKTLQMLFGFLNLGERAGSGIPKIIRASAEQHWRTIELYEEQDPAITVLKFWMISLIPDEIIEEIKVLYGEKFNLLTQTEVEILVTAFVERFVTNRRMQSLCDSHPSDLTKILQSMVERRLLLINGISGRGTKYYINHEYQKNLKSGGESGLQACPDGASEKYDDLQYSIDDLQHREESLQHKDESLQHRDESLQHKDESLQHKKTYVPSKKPGYQQVDEAIFDEIYQTVSQAKRIDARKMEAFIIEACHIMPCTVDELSNLLCRDKASLRNHYLSRMVKEGKIKLLYPDTVNHPSQAYVSTNTPELTHVNKI